MSTSDPRVDRAERQARAAARPGNTLLLVLLGAVHAAVWVAAGFGVGILLDTVRLMTVNQVGGWSSGFDGATSQLLGVGAIGLGSVLGVFLTGRLGRLGLGAAMIIPFCTAFLGIALGLVLFIPSWTEPDAVGEKVAFIDGGDREPWQSDAWIAYYLPFWLPAVFGVLLLLAIAAALAATRPARVDAGHRGSRHAGSRCGHGGDRDRNGDPGNAPDPVHDTIPRHGRRGPLGDEEGHVPARIHTTCRGSRSRLVRHPRAARRVEDHGRARTRGGAVDGDRHGVAAGRPTGLE
ncbi:hypothetical protein QCD70_05110 [Agreia sp. PsM10]|uniref:hypothetical protein n=1 Tax=Agreia sp. PsM10 TaxID=3030533 RepID=UPI00263B172C|nr:hypothetical protein [Agreia sp. PsM10]MDN4639618.1 hypothetical protein [Agreia sp. PsM10]